MAIPCCFCEPSLAPDYPLDIFIQDVNELMLYTAPLALGLVLWKLFVTNRTTPPGDVTVLGLDASSSTYSPSASQR